MHYPYGFSLVMCILVAVEVIFLFDMQVEWGEKKDLHIEELWENERYTSNKYS